MEKHQKILLIDDDPDFVEATTAVLQSKDYQVVSALSAEAGLVKARDDKPALILLDIIMPTKDGFAVCDQLKHDPDLSAIPVIILTSLSQNVGQSTVAMSAGMCLEAEDYLDKPVEPKVLLARVEKLLKKIP